VSWYDWPVISHEPSIANDMKLFSALYSMLPSARKSLLDGGFAPKAAAWTLIGCFLAGVIGIQIVSRIIHHYMPSHIVDCEHSHDEEEQRDSAHHHDHDHDHDHEHHDSQKPKGPHRHDSPAKRPQTLQQGRVATDQPAYYTQSTNQSTDPDQDLDRVETFRTALTSRPTLQSRLTSTFSKLTSAPKDACDADGPCYGFSEPCGQECFKIVQTRGTLRPKRSRSLRRPLNSRSASTPGGGLATESTPLLSNLEDVDEEYDRKNRTPQPPKLSDRALDVLESNAIDDDDQDANEPTINGSGSTQLQKTVSGSAASESESRHQHHHHVPTNAFLSIGLQTSIAIALHKLPEGFITYATNHANPRLGFSVFLALFIHNITEGFAMALPLYLAINSRWKAMFWSSLLGGFSQPLGAGVAALWFKVAGKGDLAPGEGVYGCMFAVTAGIMASVALQLFSESLDLTHNRNLCMVFAFVGMGILGFSSALTA